MIKALFTAATGMRAQQTRIDVIANNLANVNTTGFKKSQVNFEDLLYSTLRSAGSTNAGVTSPASLQVGSGARLVSTAKVFTPGVLEETGRGLDVVISGPGFFELTDVGQNLVYSRDGNFHVDANGAIVNSQGLRLNPAITAGAVISGAYFGDKLSPLSGTANLACAAAGSNLYEHFGESLRTSGPSLLAALVLFWALGSPVEFDPGGVTARIEAAFEPSFVHFTPLALVLALAIKRWPPFVAIFLGALAGGVLAVVGAPERVVAFAGEGLPRGLALLKGVWATLTTGYVSGTGESAVDQLLTRGGMASMLGTVWLILVALAFGGFIERAGVLERLIGPLTEGEREEFFRLVNKMIDANNDASRAPISML